MALPVFYAIAQYWGILSGALADVALILFTGACTGLAFGMVRRVGPYGRLGVMLVGMFACILLIDGGRED